MVSSYIFCHWTLQKTHLIIEGSISVLHPTTCGFGKVIAYELNSSNLSLENRIAKYETIFEEYKENFSVALETHQRNFPKIVEKNDWQTSQGYENQNIGRILHKVMGQIIYY